MLSNAYFLAKVRFYTAENEPAKNLQTFCKHFANFAKVTGSAGPAVRADLAAGDKLGGSVPAETAAAVLAQALVRPEAKLKGSIGEGSNHSNFTGLVLGCIETKCCKKYSLESSRRDLHNALLCTVF